MSVATLAAATVASALSTTPAPAPAHIPLTASLTVNAGASSSHAAWHGDLRRQHRRTGSSSAGTRFRVGARSPVLVSVSSERATAEPATERPSDDELARDPQRAAVSTMSGAANGSGSAMRDRAGSSSSTREPSPAPSSQPATAGGSRKRKSASPPPLDAGSGGMRPPPAHRASLGHAYSPSHGHTHAHSPHHAKLEPPPHTHAHAHSLSPRHGRELPSINTLLGPSHRPLPPLSAAPSHAERDHAPGRPRSNTLPRDDPDRRAAPGAAFRHASLRSSPPPRMGHGPGAYSHPSQSQPPQQRHFSAASSYAASAEDGSAGTGGAGPLSSASTHATSELPAAGPSSALPSTSGALQHGTFFGQPPIHPSLAGVPGFGGGPGSKQQPSFVCKLYTILEDEHIQHMVQWVNNGTAFRVLSPSDFSRIVLPTYFKHANWQSFVRQLNMYGFHKVTTATANPTASSPSMGALAPGGGAAASGAASGASGAAALDDAAAAAAAAASAASQVWEFRHPSFQRGQVHLLAHIKRKSSRQPKGQSNAQANMSREDSPDSPTGSASDPVAAVRGSIYPRAGQDAQQHAAPSGEVQPAGAWQDAGAYSRYPPNDDSSSVADSVPTPALDSHHARLHGAGGAPGEARRGFAPYDGAGPSPGAGAPPAAASSSMRAGFSPSIAAEYAQQAELRMDDLSDRIDAIIRHSSYLESQLRAVREEAAAARRHEARVQRHCLRAFERIAQVVEGMHHSQLADVAAKPAQAVPAETQRELEVRTAVLDAIQQEVGMLHSLAEERSRADEEAQPQHHIQNAHPHQHPHPAAYPHPHQHPHQQHQQHAHAHPHPHAQAQAPAGHHPDY